MGMQAAIGSVWHKQSLIKHYYRQHSDVEKPSWLRPSSAWLLHRVGTLVERGSRAWLGHITFSNGNRLVPCIVLQSRTCCPHSGSQSYLHHQMQVQESSAHFLASNTLPWCSGQFCLVRDATRYRATYLYSICRCFRCATDSRWYFCVVAWQIVHCLLACRTSNNHNAVVNSLPSCQGRVLKEWSRCIPVLDGWMTPLKQLS